VHSPQYSDEVEKESARCRLSLKFDCSLGLTKRVEARTYNLNLNSFVSSVEVPTQDVSKKG
jgi:hypothetical protein